MWCPFVYDKTNYLIKIRNDTSEILLTDLKELWGEKFILENLINKFKDVNPSFAGDENDILKEINNMIENVDVNTDLTEDGEFINLVLKGKFQELPIKIDFKLKKMESEMFYKEVTLPLIKTVQFLELKKNKMSELLIKKDQEIMQYNHQFGEINQKFRITERYKVEDVNAIDGLLLNVFSGNNNFRDILIEKHGDLQQAFPELKPEQSQKKKLKLPTGLKKRRL